MIHNFLAILCFLYLCAATSTGDQQTTLQVAERWGWKPCGYPDDPMRIDTIEVFPDPPQRGANMTVSVVGEAFDVIDEGAYADVTVKVGLIKLLQKEVDLCEEARTAKLDISCPVEPGKYRVVHTVALPKEIPPAIYAVDLNAYTMDDDDLTCLNLWIDFRLQTNQ